MSFSLKWQAQKVNVLKMMEDNINNKNNNGRVLGILEVENLYYSRNQKILFRNLTFSVNPYTCLLVTGPNGSGKTSLLKILVDLIAPDAGRVYCEVPFIYVGHQSGFKEALTLQENFEWFLDIHSVDSMNSMDGYQKQCSIEEALALFDLDTQIDIPGKHLSAGQRQKASLAKLKMLKAPLWILDEPFNSLDEAASHTFERLAIEHLKGGGSIIAATHVGFSDDFIGQTKSIDSTGLDPIKILSLKLPSQQFFPMDLINPMYPMNRFEAAL